MPLATEAPLDKKRTRAIFSPAGQTLIAKDNATTVKETMMIEENFARLHAHRNNIYRYRRLLATKLTELERSYIEKRLQDEEAASTALLQATLPLRLPSAGLPAQTAA